MKTYDFVHLVLYAAGGKIQGRTKLQKMVYFTGVLMKCEANLGYRPHFYGPYSADVAGSVDKLRALGFLKQSACGGGAIDHRGFEVARYDYELTGDGRLIAEEKVEKYPENWKRIKTAVDRLIKSDPNDYVKLSIAAKTYFVHGKLKGTTSSGELERLNAHFGWKVSEEETRDAFEWLKSVKLVEDS
jgi:uncharacterized protein YwgA